MNLTQNEIKLLRHLADGEQHIGVPQELTEAQCHVAAKQLKEKDMIHADLEQNIYQIKTAGQAVLDDLKDEEKRLLRKLVKENGLTLDQYDLLIHIKKFGELENIFGIDDSEFKEQIWGHLARLKYIDLEDRNSGDSEFVVTRQGSQVLEGIEDELCNMLAGDSNVGHTQFAVKDESQKSRMAEAIDLNNIENGDFIANEPYLRVQIKLLELLFKKAGIDTTERIPSLTGNTEKPKYNQTALAKLIGYLVKNSESINGGNNISGIKKALTENKPLNPKQHQDDVNAINKCFSELGLDWKL
ncbi:MAG: hypothetical protein KBT29_08845 [Prevotellaceae bacterium]|nr:hypothetical protein [Candidatus Minthosoma caballi]